MSPTAANKKHRSFDPDRFLATIGQGRKSLAVARKKTIFTQGDAADAVFLYSERQSAAHGRNRKPARNPPSAYWARRTSLAKALWQAKVRPRHAPNQIDLSNTFRVAHTFTHFGSDFYSSSSAHRICPCWSPGFN